MEGTPTARPSQSVTGAYKHGWRTLWAHFAILLVLGIIYVAASSVGTPITFRFELGPGGIDDAPSPTATGLATAYDILVLAPLSLGVYFGFLRAVRGQKPELENLLEGFRHYVDAVAGMFLTGLLILAGFLLLIIPGFIALVRLSFVPLLLVDRKLGALEAIKESWDATRGHGWSIFGLFLLAIPILVLGLLLLIVGVIPAIMWVTASWISYYEAVTAERP